MRGRPQLWAVKRGHLKHNMSHKLPHIWIHQGYICLNTGHNPFWADSELRALILILAMKRTLTRGEREKKNTAEWATLWK